MKNLSKFCTCKDLECPLHPANHERGCSLCIADNLKDREIPNCFFNLAGSDYSGDSYTFEDFARLVLGKSAPQSVETNCEHYLKHEDAQVEVMGNGITKRILAYDDSLMVEELIFEEGARSRMHTHTPVQIPYVKSGVFEFTVGTESFVLREGDTAYMGPDEPHCVRCIEAGTLVVSFSPAREDYIAAR